jgi:hypothetical protein
MARLGFRTPATASGVRACPGAARGASAGGSVGPLRPLASPRAALKVRSKARSARKASLTSAGIGSAGMAMMRPSRRVGVGLGRRPRGRRQWRCSSVHSFGGGLALGEFSLERSQVAQSEGKLCRYACDELSSAGVNGHATRVFEPKSLMQGGGSGGGRVIDRCLSSFGRAARARDRCSP